MSNLTKLHQIGNPEFAMDLVAELISDMVFIAVDVSGSVPVFKFYFVGEFVDVLPSDVVFVIVAVPEFVPDFDIYVVEEYVDELNDDIDSDYCC
jgi:hypothetical protein